MLKISATPNTLQTYSKYGHPQILSKQTAPSFQREFKRVVVGFWADYIPPEAIKEIKKKAEEQDVSILFKYALRQWTQPAGTKMLIRDEKTLNLFDEKGEDVTSLLDDGKYYTLLDRIQEIIDKGRKK